MREAVGAFLFLAAGAAGWTVGTMGMGIAGIPVAMLYMIVYGAATGVTVCPQSPCGMVAGMVVSASFTVVWAAAAVILPLLRLFTTLRRRTLVALLVAASFLVSGYAFVKWARSPTGSAGAAPDRRSEGS